MYSGCDYRYKSCLCTFWPCHPYFILQLHCFFYTCNNIIVIGLLCNSLRLHWCLLLHLHSAPVWRYDLWSFEVAPLCLFLEGCEDMHFQIQGYVQYYFAYFTFHGENLRPHTLIIGQRASCILVYLYPIIAHALFSTCKIFHFLISRCNSKRTRACPAISLTKLVCATGLWTCITWAWAWAWAWADHPGFSASLLLLYCLRAPVPSSVAEETTHLFAWWVSYLEMLSLSLFFFCKNLKHLYDWGFCTKEKKCQHDYLSMAHKQ